jgi:hypothetical protein
MTRDLEKLNVVTKIHSSSILTEFSHFDSMPYIKHMVKKRANFTPSLAMKAQNGSRGTGPLYCLTSALNVCGWLTPRPDRFISGIDKVPIIEQAL